jgi:hypothetical protein
VVIRPGAGSNGVRPAECSGTSGLQPLDPATHAFPALLYADSTVFGENVTVQILDATGTPLPGDVPVQYIDSTIVGVTLPIGGVPVGTYDIVYSQSGRSDTLAGAFQVIEPFCFAPRFQERKVSLLWGQSSPADSAGIVSGDFLRRIEQVPGFNGYKVWRGISPDTSAMMLLRSIERVTRDRLNEKVFVPDPISWSWRDTAVVDGVPIYGAERRFADPDSFFFRRMREKVYTSFVNGVPQESEWVDVRVPEIERLRAAPHAGVHYYYAITAQDTSGIDMTLKVDNLTDVVPQSSPRITLANVVVVPNPYYGHDWSNGEVTVHRAYWDRSADEHKIQFTHLPPAANVWIYTASGDLVEELTKTRPEIDALDWDVRNVRGDVVQAGIYLFRVENPDSGESITGHFVILP